ncbi:ubiquitin-protein transferase activating protein [Balamuthia mandrillaris]
MSLLYASPVRSRRNQNAIKSKSPSCRRAPLTPPQPASPYPFSSSSSSSPSFSRSGASPLSPSSSSSSQKNSAHSPTCDRFIANRSQLDLDLCHFKMMQARKEAERSSNSSSSSSSSSSDDNNNNNNNNNTPARVEYKSVLEESLFPQSNATSGRILSFKEKPRPPSLQGEQQHNPLRVLYSQGNGHGLFAGTPPRTRRQENMRKIDTTAQRVLDAPDLLDDYYLNLLDWSPQNILAVALDRTVFLWNAGTGAITQLTTVDPSINGNVVTSLRFGGGGCGSLSEDGSGSSSASSDSSSRYLAVGTSTAEVQIWDINEGKKVRTLRGHLARVGALAWNGHFLTSGGRDSLILNHDVRAARHVTAVLEKHTQEVCGLSWSADGARLASGGNDNLLNVWDLSDMSTRAAPRFTLDHHKAAVKALAWAPFQSNLLASGGGTADRCIRFWNTNTGACLNTIDTHSQVCALQWSRNSKELVSSHGFSQFQLSVWSYPSMTKMAELVGHTSRVLHMALSPDGTTVVSAGDETLRFWKIFEERHSRRNHPHSVGGWSSKLRSKEQGSIRSNNIR